MTYAIKDEDEDEDDTEYDNPEPEICGQCKSDDAFLTCIDCGKPLCIFCAEAGCDRCHECWKHPNRG